MKGSFSANVLCPFYITDSEQHRKVVCEGIEEGSTVSMRFKPGQKISWMNKYCFADYEKCPLYKLAYKKYE